VKDSSLRVGKDHPADGFRKSCATNSVIWWSLWPLKHSDGEYLETQGVLPGWCRCNGNTSR